MTHNRGVFCDKNYLGSKCVMLLLCRNISFHVQGMENLFREDESKFFDRINNEDTEPNVTQTQILQEESDRIISESFLKGLLISERYDSCE